ncbi:hypothetical protein AVEN_116988-1 [Araneus ventricosus]|uniref:Uncharacterized protein n=1 Tax=Araneus ventricosus TaxID=182803 RepID=A0A4Y2QS37_ARAVE|nr:hypothetical protein AVEN_116988-1 [Araneus ventricosus]
MEVIWTTSLQPPEPFTKGFSSLRNLRKKHQESRYFRNDSELLQDIMTWLHDLDIDFFFVELDTGRCGQVVRSRIWGRRVPGSKPDSTEDPPHMGPAACQTARSGQTPPQRVRRKNAHTGPAHPKRVRFRKRISVERASPRACGGRDLLGTIRKMIQA